MGQPCSFVRLTGCALRCVYCDTEYAFYGGSWNSFEEIETELSHFPTRLVQITGGEPLHQKAVWPFVSRLCDLGYEVLIETSGAVSIKNLDPRAHIVMDVKTPESGELEKMDWDNFNHLKPSDEVKFVFCSPDDLDWSLKWIKEHSLDQRFQVLVSPIASLAEKGALADRVAFCGLNVRFQVQLHKILWGDKAGK